jgi:hypothetical protein
MYFTEFEKSLQISTNQLFGFSFSQENPIPQIFYIPV